MRYYIKCKLNPEGKQRLADSIESGSMARGKIFYEGMQTALREGTIDENDIVHFVEICYCLEGGLYPMAMEIPVLNKYFDDVIEVKDARLRDQCTMECEFCDLKSSSTGILFENYCILSSSFHFSPLSHYPDH